LARGAGKPGYCKLCAHPNLPEINKQIKAGLNAAQLNAYCNERWGLTAARQTWYTHIKQHATHPADKVVAVSKLPRPNGELIRQTTDEEFTQAVIDIGMRKAIEDPDSISIDHALKAVQIRSSAKSSGPGTSP